MKKLFLSVSLLLFSAFFCTLQAEDLAGELNNIKGTVMYLQSGDTEWDTAINGLAIGPNDRIRTKPRSSCDIELDDGSMIHVAANSETSVDRLELKEEEHVSSFKLLFGKVIASISKLKKTKMEIRTPIAVCAVRGTEFAVETSSSDTNVGVFEGQVAVVNPDVAQAPGEETLVNPEQETTVEKGINPRIPAALREAMRQNRERMAEMRQRVKALRAKLKRVPSADRIKARFAAKERLQKARQMRQNQREKIQDRRRNIRQKRAPR